MPGAVRGGPCSTLLNEATSEDILPAERQHRSKRTRQHSEGHIFHPFHNRIIVDGPGESFDAGESKAVKMKAKSWVEIKQPCFLVEKRRRLGMIDAANL